MIIAYSEKESRKAEKNIYKKLQIVSWYFYILFLYDLLQFILHYLKKSIELEKSWNHGLYSINVFKIIWTLFSDNLIEYLFIFQVNSQT